MTTEAVTGKSKGRKKKTVSATLTFPGFVGEKTLI
jgi:hypothetical protein